MSDHPSLMVDEFEPVQIFSLLEQSCPVERHDLNRSGLADYVWLDCMGNTRQIERKQWGELLGSVDRVENQLREEILSADATDLLVEGIVKCTQWGLDAYVWRDDRRSVGFQFSHSFGDPQHTQTMLYAKMMAWFWQLDKAGITVWFTFSYEDTAKAIASFYWNSQKIEHSTLNRYLKPKIGIRSLDPHVLSLMGIEGAQLGQVRAEALVKQFGTLYSVITADAQELAKVSNMGKGTVSKLLKAIGREE